MSGTLIVNGSITADGNNGGKMGSYTGGGGSGGSIYIIANKILGNGLITANGGSGGDGNGGGGAGGRIAIYYAFYPAFPEANIIAAGGSGYEDGENGTIVIQPFDTTPPTITITSPVNGTTYTTTNSINLNYSVNEPTAWEGHSLDDAENVSLYGNMTLTGLSNGLHNITVYANDTAGNMGQSTVWFAINVGNELPVHNLNTGENFSTIQEAIDDVNTSNGHTIKVDAGTYTENVIVSKSISLIGAHRDNTIIDGGGSGDVIRVIVDYVTIRGFTVTNGKRGLYMNSNHSTIISNIITGNHHCGAPAYGVYLYRSSNNNITDNLVDKNVGGGWCEWKSDHGYGYSLYLSSSDNNTLINNTANENLGKGYMYRGGETEPFKTSGNGYGIYLSSSTNNSLIDNIASENWGEDGWPSRFEGYGHGYGISLELSRNNNIIGTIANNNRNYGIYLVSSSNNNRIYNNSFNNTNNAYLIRAALPF